MNGFDLARVRSGELVAGLGGLALLVFMFVPDWYTVKGPLAPTLANLGGRTTWDGWWGLAGARYLILLSVISALALLYFQAAQRAPAIPATFSVIVTVLGVASVLALIYRLLAGPPAEGGFLDQQAGVYLGLLAALAVTYGGYRSLREESGSEIVSEGEIETARIGQRSGS